MAPPSYSDLGKNAKDVFAKGYNWGFFKLDAKSKTGNGVDLKAALNSNRESGKVAGNLETKYKWSDYGLTFTEKWNTENVLNTQIKIEDQLAEGLELTFDTSFAPQTGKKSGKVSSAYKMDYIHLNCDVDFDFAGPTVHGAAVLGYEGWLAGYQMSFDSSKSKLTKSNFGFGYSGGDFSFTTNVNDGQEFTGSVHQKVNDNLDAAVNLSWQSGSGNTTFALGAKYKLDADASISAKVNNSSHVGLGYTQKLRDGIKLTVSSLIDGKNINQGGHKVGLGLEFEA
jgi:voltage-dependent anion channel protein 2